MSGPDPQVRRQWAEAELWFAKADDDIRMAALGLAADPPLLDPAAFHCQQAVEKIIKGLLVAAAVKAPHIHDLVVLSALALPSYPQLAEHMNDLAPATAWLARTRYPGLTDGIGSSVVDVADTLTAVKEFRRIVGTLVVRSI